MTSMNFEMSQGSVKRDIEKSTEQTHGLAELFSLNSNPLGLPFREWTTLWWIELLSRPKKDNPICNIALSGIISLIKHNGSNVCFLVGTTGGYAERICTLPSNTAVLCPIINFEISEAEEPSLRSDADLATFAKNDVDKIAKLDVTIDGTTLSNPEAYRIDTPPFSVTLPEDNLWGVKQGSTRAAGDGYWLFLKPLPAGRHTIQFGGSCLAGTINIGSTYTLIVNP